MGGWWRNEVVAAGKLPLAICLGAFILTFLSTRVITRMIRAGKGPFRNNVLASGTHIHHAVPGIILLVLGALMSLALDVDESPWIEIAAVLIGAGASLVLDEFALILHLDDVYWQNEGRVSVEMIGLTGACLGLVILGYNPIGDTDLSAQAFGIRVVLVTGVLVHGLFVLVCVFKGKYRAALIGSFVPIVAWWCAARLARPTSWWARHVYGEKRRTKAVTRAQNFDARWDPRWRWLSDVIAGSPTRPDLPDGSLPSDPVTAGHGSITDRA
jgi:hypothetical protein